MEEIPKEKELNVLEWAKFRDHFYEVRGKLSTGDEFENYENCSPSQRHVLNEFRKVFERVPDQLSEEELQIKHLKEI